MVYGVYLYMQYPANHIKTADTGCPAVDDLDYLDYLLIDYLDDLDNLLIDRLDHLLVDYLDRDLAEVCVL